jgi:hypothetical protein
LSNEVALELVATDVVFHFVTDIQVLVGASSENLALALSANAANISAPPYDHATLATRFVVIAREMCFERYEREERVFLSCDPYRHLRTLWQTEIMSVRRKSHIHLVNPHALACGQHCSQHSFLWIDLAEGCVPPLF